MSKIASPAYIEKYLKGIPYPATREQLIEKAQDSGAPEEVIETLQALKDDEIRGPIHLRHQIAEAF